MEPHSIQDWTTILGRANASQCSAEYAAAERIIADLVGYNWKSRHRRRDTQELATALEAYAVLVQRAGLRLPDPCEGWTEICTENGGAGVAGGTAIKSPELPEPHIFEYNAAGGGAHWMGQFRRSEPYSNWFNARSGYGVSDYTTKTYTTKTAALAGAKICAWQSIVDSGEVWKMSAAICEHANRLIKTGVLKAKTVEVG